MAKISSINKTELKRLINASSRILLTTHQGPDGDGLGSQIAMYYHLKSLNKKCRIINISKMPEKYFFIDPERIVEHYNMKDDPWIENSDLVLIFDIGDSKRVGTIAKKIYNDKIVVSIDHHPVKKNEPFSYIWIDESAPATGYMIWEYLFEDIKYEKIPLNQALPLYVALVTDTGSFRYSNTHANSHLMAHQLIKSGVKPEIVNRHVYESRKLNQVKLLGNAINNLNFKFDNKIAWVNISNDIINQLGIEKENIEGFADFIRSIEGVEVGFVLIENKDDIKISLRSQGTLIINDIAAKLGGGGHKYAAGANLKNESLVGIETRILELLDRKVRES